MAPIGGKGRPQEIRAVGPKKICQKEKSSQVAGFELTKEGKFFVASGVGYPQSWTIGKGETKKATEFKKKPKAV